jgi:hypothetical protein
MRCRDTVFTSYSSQIETTPPPPAPNRLQRIMQLITSILAAAAASANPQPPSVLISAALNATDIAGTQQLKPVLFKLNNRP